MPPRRRSTRLPMPVVEVMDDGGSEEGRAKLVKSLVVVVF